MCSAVCAAAVQAGAADAGRLTAELATLRAKLDAQLEIRQLCELMWPHLVTWAPQFADWYEKSRLHRARLAP